jgi:predicted site-specific integrase-resolvase
MQIPMVDTDKLLRPSQAAKIIGVSKSRVNRYCREGRLGFRIGDQFFIPIDQAKKFKAMPTGRPKLKNSSAKRPG